ncbi:hypothetical protein ACG2OD_14665 [Streptomyces sp. PDY-4]|uniref:hypothetical protein n=1 Tax=Streptomyces sp. PDY-4 TaxID=3376070 RepID=UPI0037A65969
MSAIKAIEADVRDAQRRAAAAAGMSDRDARVRAFLALCEELGDVAKRYQFPFPVARALVHVATEAYFAARKAAVLEAYANV